MLSIKKRIIRLVKNMLIDDVKPKSPTFRESFISFLEGLNGANRSRSYANDVITAKHILDGLGDYKMEEINKDVLKHFINSFTQKTYTKGTGKRQKTHYYSQSSIDKVYNLLHCFIKEVSCEDGSRLLPTDYMANIKKPRSNQALSSEIHPLTDNEIKKILAVVKENQKIYTWIILLLYTGTRPSEPLALKISDVNFENKTIDIFRTLSQEYYIDPVEQKRTRPRKAVITDLKNDRKGGQANYQRRTLRVGDNLFVVLREWIAYIQSDVELINMKKWHHTEDYLFTGPQGQLWLYDDYKQVYERLLRKNGLSVSEYNPYRFRHNCCTRLLRLGINLKAVQLILGDNTPTMVMNVYANLDKSDVLQGSQSFSESIDKALGVLTNQV